MTHKALTLRLPIEQAEALRSYRGRRRDIDQRGNPPRNQRAHRSSTPGRGSSTSACERVWNATERSSSVSLVDRLHRARRLPSHRRAHAGSLPRQSRTSIASRLPQGPRLPPRAPASAEQRRTRTSRPRPPSSAGTSSRTTHCQTRTSAAPSSRRSSSSSETDMRGCRHQATPTRPTRSSAESRAAS